ncbi:MAG: interleukin-like EMT inducer domain-containing protein [Chloroflexota bacterium]
MNSSRKYRADIFALVAYAVLALALTYPLILNPTTHVAGDGSDDPALAWNLWWVPHALINLGASPIYCDYMFYPIGLNLAFYTLTYLNAFLSIPFQSAFNLALAANVNLWFSFAVGGLGAYLLAKYLFKVQGSRFEVAEPETHLKLETLSAFAAGALYAFSSNKFLYASLGQFNIASSHWIPFYVLFLLKVTAKGFSIFDFRFSIRYGFLLGLFLLFQSLSEFIYASFLIIFTALYLVYRLLTTRFRLITDYRLRITFLIAALVFVIPMSPILAAMFQDMAMEGDFIQQGLGFADVFSSDALGFFVPSHLHPILGGLEAQFHFAYINFAYLGFVALALALIALWKIPQARVWGVFGASFVLISLGPALLVNGARFDLPLPFDLLLEIPFVKGNRYPSRWSVMVALAVLVGYGMAWLLARIPRNILRLRSGQAPHASRISSFILLTFALLFEHLSAPLPLSDLRIPDVYKTIARDSGDFTVLEIPLAWRNGYRMTGTLDKAMMFAQWYQTAHQHPILGGNTSRNPELKFQYFTEAPVINSLIAVETGHKLDDATIQRDQQLAPDVLRFFGVRYVVWHSPRDPANRAALDAARAYVESVLPVTKFYDATDETGRTIAYRVDDLPPLNQTLIRAKDPLARLNFAEGWGTLGETSVWATRREAKMFVRLDSPREVVLALRAFAPMSNQRVAVQVNGIAAGILAMPSGWGEYALSVKREVWRAGMNEIVLQFDALAPVASVRVGEYAIGATAVASPVSIVARSAGSEVGDFAHSFVNGVDAAKNSRGYNVVVINATTGAVEASAAFDTFASAEESARLAQFIAKIPDGRIAAVAVRDEASRYLSEDAVTALRSIGAREDLRGKFRWSHAIIGVRGAPPGSALESANEIAPAQLVVGVGALEPDVAAAVEWIKITTPSQ